MPDGQHQRHRYRAVLACGNTLYYDSSSFVPSTGERVPCLRHQFCRVVTTRVGADEQPDVRRPRAQRRTSAELLLFLQEQSDVTVAELRRHRYTLRLIATATAAGLVHVDGWDQDAAVRLTGCGLAHHERSGSRHPVPA